MAIKVAFVTGDKETQKMGRLTHSKSSYAEGDRRDEIGGKKVGLIPLKGEGLPDFNWRFNFGLMSFSGLELPLLKLQNSKKF